MAATLISSFSLLAIAFLSLIAMGHSQCVLSMVEVEVTETSGLVESKPEWNVTIANKCPCTLSNLVVDCKGFQSTETVPSSVLSVEGDDCVVQKGNVISPMSLLSFNYAWEIKFPFTAKSFQPNCS